MITKRMTILMSRGVPGARMDREEVEQLPLNNGRPQGDDQHDNEVSYVVQNGMNGSSKLIIGGPKVIVADSVI